LHNGVIVRDALPAELPRIGALRLAAYQAGDFLADESNYGETLRTLGFDGTGQILAAVSSDGGDDDGDLLGTVMLQFWPHAQHVVRSPDEAEVRALAVAPEAQGQGAGRALLRACIEIAAARGARQLVLCTQADMAAAQHLYADAGFRRLPDRDWSPVPGFTLLSYGLTLDPAAPVTSPPGRLAR